MRSSELFTKITNQTGLFNIQAIDNIPSIMQRGLLPNVGASSTYASFYSPKYIGARPRETEGAYYHVITNLSRGKIKKKWKRKVY